MAQSAGLRTDSTIDLHRLRLAANSRLPEDIAIRSIEEMPRPWHATASASGKHYRYCIWADSDKPLYSEAPFFYHFYRPLDVDLMNAAARLLLGTHDFKSFETTSREARENTVRTLHQLEVSRQGPRLQVDVRGDGFLYRMVRNLVGTLLDVGRGKREPETMTEILAACDRRAAGGTAPALGLTMMRVYYGDQPWHLDPVEASAHEA